jgi:cyclic dehypoxanthinyl futalosine synthase
MSIKKKIDTILEESICGRRISEEEALLLLREASLYKLGHTADVIRENLYREKLVTFVIDRNINYTNICINQCDFCAFYQDIDSSDGYFLNAPQILKRIEEATAMGATQIMLQGGLYPRISIDYFIELFNIIKDKFDVTLHSLSPPEIIHIANNSGLGIEETLSKLKDAGLDSLPGGGAEILSKKTRQRISPKKISSDEWLSVMRSAHDAGLFSTATMMFGIGEETGERIAHLEKIRALQDKTGKFRAFIPWTFMPGNTNIGGREVSAEDYLKTLSLSRIYLDNIKNIQGSWLTQSEDIGQLSLFYGANDLGSTMLEENVVRSTGIYHDMDVQKIVYLIKKCGFIPAKRDTEYRILKKYTES